MKKVALVMESWGRYITNAWISGILSKIKEADADVNLYVFNAYANWSTDELYNQGEHDIFDLPDFCDFDGVIVELNNTEEPAVRADVIERVRASGTPAILINAKEDGFYLVGVNNYQCMYDNISFLYNENSDETTTVTTSKSSGKSNTGLIIGIIVGSLYSSVLINNIKFSELYLVKQIEPLSYIKTAGFIISFTVIVGIGVHFMLKKLKMIESLKSIE